MDWCYPDADDAVGRFKLGFCRKRHLGASASPNPSPGNEVSMVAWVVARSDVGAKPLLSVLDAAATTEHSFQGETETDRWRSLEEQLAKQSPNGKILADSNIRLMIDVLYNQQKREAMKSLAESHGRDAVTVEQLGRTLSGQTGGTRRRQRKKVATTDQELMNDRHLFSPGWGFACKECGWVSVKFKDKQAGLRAFDGADLSPCPSCDRKSMGLLEVRHMDDQVVQAISQNIWLEDLVAEAVRPDAEFCVSGRVTDIGTEFDVVAVVQGRVVVFECKDGTFGGNDFAALLERAREIDADYAGVVTTSRIHENVTNRMDSRPPGELRVFRVHDLEEADRLRDAITEQISAIKHEALSDFVGQILEPVTPWRTLWRRDVLRVS